VGVKPPGFLCCRCPLSVVSGSASLCIRQRTTDNEAAPSPRGARPDFERGFALRPPAPHGSTTFTFHTFQRPVYSSICLPSGAARHTMGAQSSFKLEATRDLEMGG
jgi:hypothetical protein